MKIVERIVELCQTRNISLNALEKEVGIGRGTIARWDNNIPAVDKVLRVADYFGVSLDYLLSRNEKKAPAEVQELTHMENELILNYRLATEEDKPVLLRVASLAAQASSPVRGQRSASELEAVLMSVLEPSDSQTADPEVVQTQSNEHR